MRNCSAHQTQFIGAKVTNDVLENIHSRIVLCHKQLSNSGVVVSAQAVKLMYLGKDKPVLKLMTSYIIVTYQHIFKTTYLYGSYSPINGNSFVWEISGVNTKIFEAYLKAFSVYKPNEYKIVVIDNAGFHSTKNIQIPHNIYLLRIPPYNPELNPCEQMLL